MSISINQKLKVFIVLLISIIVIYRFQFANNFSILQGDLTAYDNTIQSSILEHWFNFFKGNANWLDAGYFYPYSRTIAQTDGYFLTGIIYTPFRFLGIEPYLATELVGLTLKIIGFFGALILSRRVFKLSLNYSLLVSTLFTLSNAMTSHGYRIQLATVAFVPWLFLIHFETIKSFFEKNWPRFIRLGTLGSIFFGAWCITCFYMAWFYAFYSAIFALILVYAFRKNLKNYNLIFKSSLKPLLTVFSKKSKKLQPYF